MKNKTNEGRQLALNYMFNTLYEYAEAHGLKFPEFLDKKTKRATIKGLAARSRKGRAVGVSKSPL